MTHNRLKVDMEFDLICKGRVKYGIVEKHDFKMDS